MTQDAKVAVIIPAWNAEDTIEACISAVLGSTRKPDEVLLYNDGSSDRTGEIAESFGITVLTNSEASVGPAIGRHRCAQETDAEILVFVDADVEVDSDAIRILTNEILSDDKVGGAFGSYDEDPHCTNVAAKYMNLRHHYIHGQSSREASTFWTGLGAIRSEVYKSLGGFDFNYDKPSIEDVELGTRILNHGWRVTLAAEAKAKHWKNWTLMGVWETDIFKRAMPWSKLIVEGETKGEDLNTSHKEKFSAVLAHSMWFVGLISLFIPQAFVIFLTVTALYLVLNAGLYALFLRKSGIGLMFAGAALHWLYHLYASVVFGVILVRYSLMRRSPEAKTKVSPTHSND